MDKASFSAGKYIIINTLLKTLDIYQGSLLVKSYDIATSKSPTPTGQYKVVSKTYHPTGIKGTRWLEFSCDNRRYKIHGTDITNLIGKASIGSISIHKDHIEQLFSLVHIGTPVIIVAKSEKAKPAQSAHYQTEQKYTEVELTDEDVIASDVQETPLEPVKGEVFQLETKEQLANGFYYEVIPGDTLWTVARRFGIPVQLLVSYNSLENPNRIHPGQKVFIPKGRTGYKSLH